MNIIAVLNVAGGTMRCLDVADVTRRLEEGLAGKGHTVQVEAMEPGRLGAVLEKIAGRKDVDALLIGGGDGTVSSAAAALAGSEVALGVLPLGTMNLFARDLKVPLDLDSAIAALAEGEIESIDLGQVNGTLFVNHCSIGLHPWMIRHREHQQKWIGRRKWFAMGRAWMRALKRFPRVDIEMRVGGERRHLRTNVLIIVNNPFREGAGPIPGHEHLDEHALAVYVAKSASRLGLVRLILNATMGHWSTNPMLDSFVTPSITLTRRRRKTVRASIDGETRAVTAPLVAKSLPAALKVLKPKAAE